MPNWCMNKLTVSHSDPSMVDRFEKAYNLGKACSEFLPLPEGEDWYNWQINNWGTKWDIGADMGTDKEERYGLKLRELRTKCVVRLTLRGRRLLVCMRLW